MRIFNYTIASEKPGAETPLFIEDSPTGNFKFITNPYCNQKIKLVRHVAFSTTMKFGMKKEHCVAEEGQAPEFFGEVYELTNRKESMDVTVAPTTFNPYIYASKNVTGTYDLAYITISTTNFVAMRYFTNMDIIGVYGSKTQIGCLVRFDNREKDNFFTVYGRNKDEKKYKYYRIQGDLGEMSMTSQIKQTTIQMLRQNEKKYGPKNIRIKYNAFEHPTHIVCRENAKDALLADVVTATGADSESFIVVTIPDDMEKEKIPAYVKNNLKSRTAILEKDLIGNYDLRASQISYAFNCKSFPVENSDNCIERLVIQ